MLPNQQILATLKKEGRKRYQENRTLQFEAARSPTTNPALYEAIHQLNDFHVNLALTFTEEEKQNIAKEPEKYNEVFFIRAHQKYLQSFKETLRQILQKCATPLNVNDGILQTLSLTQCYLGAAEQALQAFNIAIETTLRSIQEYLNQLSENGQERFPPWTSDINREHNRICRPLGKAKQSLDKLKALAHQYQKQLSLLSSIDDETPFQIEMTAPIFERPINISALIKATFFGSVYTTRTALDRKAIAKDDIATPSTKDHNATSPTDVVKLVLSQLNGHDFSCLSRASHAHNELLTAYRHTIAQGFLAKPPSSVWQAFDYLSPPEILTLIEIDELDSLSTLIHKYKKTSQNYGYFKYWRAVLLEPTNDSFTAYTEQFYGLKGLSLETSADLCVVIDSDPTIRAAINTDVGLSTMLKLVLVTTPILNIVTNLAARIRGVVAKAQEIKNRFSNGTGSAFVKHGNKSDLESLIVLIGELKTQAAIIEIILDKLILYSHHKIIEKFTPINQAVKKSFSDFYQLLRDAPFCQRLTATTLSNLFSHLDKHPSFEKIFLAILTEPEFAHIFARFNGTALFDFVINKPKLETAVIEAIVERNKPLLAKIDAENLVKLALRRGIAAKAIMDCNELSSKLSTEQCEQVAELRTNYQDNLLKLKSAKRQIITLLALRAADPDDTVHTSTASSQLTEVSLPSLIRRYHLLSQSTDCISHAYFPLPSCPELSELADNLVKLATNGFLGFAHLERVQTELGTRMHKLLLNLIHYKSNLELFSSGNLSTIYPDSLISIQQYWQFRNNHRPDIEAIYTLNEPQFDYIFILAILKFPDDFLTRNTSKDLDLSQIVDTLDNLALKILNNLSDNIHYLDNSLPDNDAAAFSEVRKLTQALLCTVKMDLPDKSSKEEAAQSHIDKYSPINIRRRQERKVLTNLLASTDAIIGKEVSTNQAAIPLRPSAEHKPVDSSYSSPRPGVA